MDIVPVTIAFHRLFCYHGADEGDSEPYLWTIGFTIDGRTITHAPDAPKLTGGPDFFFSPGSHGSLGGPMSIGSQRSIPRVVGRFDTTLQPIVLSVEGRILKVPGFVGLIGILLEENSTSDAGADAAHAAINELVRVELLEAVEDVNLAGLAIEIANAVSAGAKPEHAARAIFTARVERVVQRIQRYAQSTAVNAIVSRLSFPGAIIEGADPDEFMGISVNVFSQEDLDRTEDNRRHEITQRIVQAGVHPEASDFAYNLHGEAWRRVKIVTTPITDQVPPGRWQVTGKSRLGTRLGKAYISHLGGSFQDGSPWLLSKGQVMDMLGAGTHTFFVRGEHGVEADVIIQPEPLNPLFPSLTTVADRDPTNNLGRLPQCPMGISHVHPVD